jgi:diaminohydroxyphosphoribosylaminopyrimidine deaminase/5-amino-6-(5-phosphoribosylamino)uracil reductase
VVQNAFLNVPGVLAVQIENRKSKIQNPEDARWMRRALRLAARGYTPPNPMVGCVLVKDGTVVGEGWHPYAGALHAEAFALQSAGEKARGATAYVSLEPCVHFGRTPPCSRALIAAGVARVVAAVTDPNPQVAGQGLAALREAEIAAEVGLLESEARRLNEAFFHFHATGKPFVTLKAAMTLDGKIATRTGDSKWITGARARRYVHRLRAQSGAVLCGVGTVLADDPLLTARLPGMPRQPLRIVLDTHLRTPPDSKLVATARETPVLVATGEAADRKKAALLEAQGVEILRLPADINEQVSLDCLLEEMGRREIISLLVEGGGRTHAAFLEGRHAHRLLWFVAPKLIGGRDAPTSVEGDGAAAMADAVTLTEVRVRRCGPDILIDCVPFYV